jgi:streptogramin lyase
MSDDKMAEDLAAIGFTDFDAVNAALDDRMGGPVEAYGPVYQRGLATLDVGTLEQLGVDLTKCVFGIQVHEDGRVWVCVNGATFLRFKPEHMIDRISHLKPEAWYAGEGTVVFYHDGQPYFEAPSGTYSGRFTSEQPPYDEAEPRDT